MCFVFACNRNRKKKKRWGTFMWYVFNFTSARLIQNNLYVLRVLCKTWHLSRNVSFSHVLSWLLDTKQHRTISRKQENSSQQQCRFWDKPSISRGLISAVHELIAQKWCFVNMWWSAHSPPFDMQSLAPLCSTDQRCSWQASGASAHPPPPSTHKMLREPKEEELHSWWAT